MKMSRRVGETERSREERRICAQPVVIVWYGGNESGTGFEDQSIE